MKNILSGIESVDETTWHKKALGEESSRIPGLTINILQRFHHIIYEIM